MIWEGGMMKNSTRIDVELSILFCLIFQFLRASGHQHLSLLEWFSFQYDLT
jgi:hypothetical protein